MNGQKRQPFRAFTGTSDGLLRVLKCPVKISLAFDPGKLKEKPQPEYHDFSAIWDTGATASAITQQVVDRCELKPISLAQVRHADGQTNAEVYLINVKLPNDVAFCNIRATKLKLANTDMLIGMDVITMGDFAITNVGGKTAYSFRVPSLQRIDYVEQANALDPKRRSEPKPGRNEPCPCGSGRKYKKCCGAG